MNKKFLLTYSVEGCQQTYAWFDDEKSLKDFINNTKDIKVFDAIEMISSREIDVRFL